MIKEITWSEVDAETECELWADLDSVVGEGKKDKISQGRE